MCALNGLSKLSKPCCSPISPAIPGSAARPNYRTVIHSSSFTPAITAHYAALI